ncbi:MAG: class I SAM-dependent methyltransferase [Planctomycetota bacterium]
MAMSENESKVAELLQRYCPRGRVLDFPCGKGGLYAHLRSRGYETVAADIDPGALELPDVECRRADLDGELPFDDDSFEAICCVAGLEHTENPRHTLREFRRIVRPGGWVLVQVPNFASLLRRTRFLFRGRLTKNRPEEVRLDQPKRDRGHISCLPPAWFRQEFRCALLEVVHREFFHLHGRTAVFSFPLWSLLCLQSWLRARRNGSPDPVESTSPDVLLNRQCVIVGRKPDGPVRESR